MEEAPEVRLRAAEAREVTRGDVQGGGAAREESLTNGENLRGRCIRGGSGGEGLEAAA